MALTAEQLEERKLGLGSSDAAVVAGVSPWKTRAELWLEKTGKSEPADLSGNELIHFGNVLEQVVSDEFARRRGVDVRRRSQAFVHPEHPFIRANADRIVLREDALLEAKTADKFTADKWDDEVPIYYRAQCHHLMMASRRKRIYLAVLIGGNEYRDFEIEHDSEMEELLLAREIEFWRYVETDTPPPAQSAADVLLLYQANKDAAIEATPELLDLHRELLEVRAKIKDAERQFEAMKDIFCVYLGENEILVNQDGKPVITWKQASAKPRVDYERAYLILANQVDRQAADAALATATYQPKGSRRFLPKELQ